MRISGELCGEEGRGRGKSGERGKRREEGVDAAMWHGRELEGRVKGVCLVWVFSLNGGVVKVCRC